MMTGDGKCYALKERTENEGKKGRELFNNHVHIHRDEGKE
jgi:hypothetical protein